MTETKVSVGVETDISCPGCHKEFNTSDRQARILRCLHSCCSECLQKLQDKGEVKCPKCKVASKIEKAVEELPLDPVATRLVVHNQVKKKEKIPCKDCDETPPAESRCKDCRIFICQDCTFVHKRHKATKGHDILTLQQLSDQPISEFGHGHSCRDHEAFQMDCFCSMCKTPCCIKCTRSPSHKGHTFEDISQVASQAEAGVDGKTGELKRLIQTLRVAKTEGERQELELEKRQKESIIAIKATFEELEQALNDRKVKVLNEFNQRNSKLISAARNNINQLDLMLEKLDTSLTICSGLKDLADDNEKLEVFPIVTSRFQMLKTEGQNQNTTVDKTTVVFDPLNKDEATNLIKKVGSIAENENGPNANSTELTDVKRVRPELPPRPGSAATRESGLDIGQITVYFETADITKSRCDAIVSSAKTDLANDCGVGLPIARAAGAQLNRECRDSLRDKGGSHQVTDVVVTTAGSLPSKHVLHAVRPTWSGNKKTFFSDLMKTLLRCMCEASNLNAKTVAIPAIGTGMTGVPNDECAKMYVRAVKIFTHLTTNTSVKAIYFTDTDDTKTSLVRTTFSNLHRFKMDAATEEEQRVIQQYLRRDSLNSAKKLSKRSVEKLTK